MLEHCIRSHLYLNSSHQEPGNDGDIQDAWAPASARPAPKIIAADRFIDWTTWTRETILRRHRVIGPLWSLAKVHDHSETTRRIIWSAGFEPTTHTPDIELPVGQPMVIKSPSSSRHVYVRACDDQILKIGSMKIEGGEEAEPLRAVTRAGMNDATNHLAGDPLFRSQLLSTLPDNNQGESRSSRKAV